MHLFKPWCFQPSLAPIEEAPYIGSLDTISMEETPCVEVVPKTIYSTSLRTRVTSWFTKSLSQLESEQQKLVVPIVAPPLLVLSDTPHLVHPGKTPEGGVSCVSGRRIVQVGGNGFLTALDTRRRNARAGDPVVVVTPSLRKKADKPESGDSSSYMAYAAQPPTNTVTLDLPTLSAKHLARERAVVCGPTTKT